MLFLIVFVDRSTPSKLLAIQFSTTVCNITVSLADYRMQLFEVAGGSQDLRSQLREVCVSSAVEGRSTVLLVHSSSCSSQHWENICKIMNEGVLTLAFCPKPPPLILHTHTYTHKTHQYWSSCMDLQTAFSEGDILHFNPYLSTSRSLSWAIHLLRTAGDEQQTSERKGQENSRRCSASVCQSSL